MVSLLAHQGVGDILEDSSGNGGASVAAYAAAAGIDAKILAPDSTSEAKTLQSRMHGAALELVPGPRQATADEAVRQSSRALLREPQLAPVLPAGHEADRVRDLGGPRASEAPDAVLIPVGAGSLALGCSIGFNELLRAGAIARLPRLLVVQPEHCQPAGPRVRGGRATR